MKSLHFKSVEDLQLIDGNSFESIIKCPSIAPYPAAVAHFQRMYDRIKLDRSKLMKLEPPPPSKRKSTSKTSNPKKTKSTTTTAVPPSTAPTNTGAVAPDNETIAEAPNASAKKFSKQDEELLSTHKGNLPTVLKELVSNLRSWNNGSIFISAAGTLQHATLSATPTGYKFTCHCSRKARTPGVYTRNDRDSKSLNWNRVKEHVENIAHKEKDFLRNGDIVKALFPDRPFATVDQLDQLVQ